MTDEQSPLTDADGPEPLAEWIRALGIVDRPSGLEKAHASRQWPIAAAQEAFGHDFEFEVAVVLLGGLVTRGIGLHDATCSALEADNPFAAFTLLRAYAENAAALLYAVEHPNKIRRMLGLDGNKAMAVGKIIAHVNQSSRFGPFKDIYSELSEYAHPASKSYTASMSLGDQGEFQWSGNPSFRVGNDFLVACAWTVELAQANAHLIGEFAGAQGW